jgi:hypothetical protein
MTLEGEALDSGDAALAESARLRKEAANQQLQECSSKYNALMKQHREKRAAN